MFKIGDTIISKNNTSYHYDGDLWLTKHRSYIIKDKFFITYNVWWFEIINDRDAIVQINLQQLERYFLSKKEIRKLKLEKIK